MKRTATWLVGTLVVLGAVTAASAQDLKEKVKLEIESVGTHPGMEPGMYVCALDHLHIKLTAQNLADVPLGRIKVAGKAFGADGALIGTGTSATKGTTVKPGEKAPIDLEFRTITGPQIKQVKKHEITITEAPVKQ